jgi:hypothetical protein
MEYTKERAMAWLGNNWNTPKSCPICKQNNWTISESLALIPRLIQDGKETAEGLVYPHFLVTCGTCGYTLFFNAVVAGLLSSKPEEEKKES